MAEGGLYAVTRTMPRDGAARLDSARIAYFFALRYAPPEIGSSVELVFFFFCRVSGGGRNTAIKRRHNNSAGRKLHLRKAQRRRNRRICSASEGGKRNKRLTISFGVKKFVSHLVNSLPNLLRSIGFSRRNKSAERRCSARLNSCRQYRLELRRRRRIS